VRDMPPKEKVEKKKAAPTSSSEAPSKPKATKAAAAAAPAAKAAAAPAAKAAAAPASKAAGAPVAKGEKVVKKKLRTTSGSKGKKGAKRKASDTKGAKSTSAKKVAAPTVQKITAPVAGAPTPVPESVLKKRKAQEVANALNKTRAAEKKVKRKQTRKLIFQKAEAYVKEYRIAERDLIRSKRQAKNNGNFFKLAESKLAFVTRIRGINRVAPKTKKILQLLRLRQIHNGVFVKLNAATITMLKLVEPFLAYGYPNLKTVSDLIYKRGFGKINKQRIPLTDNIIIAKSLGKYGIICMEDLIHEIYTVGPHFKEANNFLWPFKLSTPLGGWPRSKKTHFAEGGSAGNREELINQLVRRMN